MRKGQYKLYRADVTKLIHHGLLIWLPQHHPPEGAQAKSQKDEGGQDGAQTLYSRDRAEIKWLSQHFSSRCWLSLEQFYCGESLLHCERLSKLSHEYGLPIVACGDVHMHSRERHALADTLAAIRAVKPLHEMGYQLAKNNERYLRPRGRLNKFYASDALAQTMVIARAMSFFSGRIKLPVSA